MLDELIRDRKIHYIHFISFSTIQSSEGATCIRSRRTTSENVEEIRDVEESPSFFLLADFSELFAFEEFSDRTSESCEDRLVKVLLSLSWWPSFECWCVGSADHSRVSFVSQVEVGRTYETEAK